MVVQPAGIVDAPGIISTTMRTRDNNVGMRGHPLAHGGALCIGLALALGGCTSVPHKTPGDPLESVNRAVYEFNDVADRYVAKPVAKVYDKVLPGFVKTGIRNFFNNIDDVFVVANDLLQGKGTQAARDTARLIGNSVFGVFGFIDVASPLGLYKNNEDFGQTLGVWGVGGGPYLVVPFLGPSNLRDLAGFAVFTQADLIWRIDRIPVRNSLVGMRTVEARAQLLPAEGLLDEAAMDRYSFLRDAYLQRRLSLIHDGNPPRDRQTEEDLEDPGEGSADDPGEGSADATGEGQAEASKPPAAEAPATPPAADAPATPAGTQPRNESAGQPALPGAEPEQR
jgi:phospholipid-binding lipoprotein MlaA